MLIITGTQRSGTSFTIKFFKECGFDVGSDFWHEDINGGLENIETCLFFRKYLGDTDFPFSDMPISNFKYKNLEDIDYPVIKFSYLLMNPIFPYIWNKYRGNKDHFLILKRKPLSIIKSKNRVSRFNTDSILLNQSQETIADNFSNSIRVFDKLNFKYRICLFPEILKNFSLFSDSVETLGLNIKNKNSIWDSLVDFDKVHYE